MATGNPAYDPAIAGSSSLTPPATIDGTGLTTSVPLTIKNGKNLSGIELQQTSTAATGFILRDAAGVQQGAIGLNNAANDWETPSLAGDLVITCSATSGKGIVLTPAAGNTNGRVELLSTVGVVGTNGGYVSVSDATGTIVGYNAAKITIVSSTVVTGALLISASTSLTNLAMAITGDLNTGIGQVTGTADTISVACAGAEVARFGGITRNITSDSGGLKLAVTNAQAMGLWGATPVVQPASTGTTTTGFTANASANALFAESTFTGNVGATAYTVSDIIKNLKTAGILAS